MERRKRFYFQYRVCDTSLRPVALILCNSKWRDRIIRDLEIAVSGISRRSRFSMLSEQRVGVVCIQCSSCGRRLAHATAGHAAKNDANSGKKCASTVKYCSKFYKVRTEVRSGVPLRRLVRFGKIIWGGRRWAKSFGRSEIWFTAVFGYEGWGKFEEALRTLSIRPLGLLAIFSQMSSLQCVHLGRRNIALELSVWGAYQSLLP